jgi:hemoglobin/transferrin/lactoferrin receptor protein
MRGGKSAKALRYGVSVFALMAVSSVAAHGQTVLDTITVVASKTEEKAIDALAAVSVVNQSTIQMINPSRLNQIFYGMPGVSFMDRGDSPESSINIRGLQDFGRVAVVVDGARQNYQRTGHNANGSFFLDPELLAGVDVVRGPTANIYGSGAIGGVASFRTKDVDDILRPGERWATEIAGSAGSNSGRGLASGFTGVRVNPNLDVFMGATHRMQSNYTGGDGIEISNTANHVSTGIAKVTIRPADGHEVKFGGIVQEDLYNIGQYARPGAGNGGTSVYDTDVRNYQANARWKYYRPEDNLFNWDGNVYWNRTENDQTKIAHNSATSPVTSCWPRAGNAISGCVGDPRGYNIDTIGFDVNNTSRFELNGWRSALTVGADGFRDDVDTFDTSGNSNVTTPGGVRTVAGGFVQLKSNFSTWLEIISAVRYDNYDLSSSAGSASGDRWSPKVTLGITPIAGLTPYVSYAEGYRAPSITETLIAGAHASPTTNSNLFFCPSGAPAGPPFNNPNGNLFCFLPNPNLRPEVGKTSEVGLNLKYDNIFSQGDNFRGKFNLFRNNLEDYIELVQFGTPIISGGNPNYPFYQYQNVAKAHIEGFEAETMYDAGAWFVGVSGQIMRGYNDVTGQGLINIPGNKLATTGGLRFFDKKMTLAAQWVSVASNQHVPSNYLPSTSYDLLNFYMTFQPAKDLWLNFSVDNALDRYYRPYAIPRGSDSGGTQNDVLWASVPPGTVYKASMRIRFSAM